MSDETIETKRPKVKSVPLHSIGAIDLPPSDVPAIRFLPCTDVGNAERFAAQHADDVRYSHDGKMWWHYEGGRWRPDDTGEAYRRAKSTARSIRQEAASTKKPEVAEALAGWAHRSEGASALRAMLECARGEHGIPVSPDDFDADPWLFNVKNGTVNLLTGTLFPHDRKQMLSKQSPVAFDDKAECPTFMRFLEEVQPNAHVRTFLQRLAGYWMTGVIREHVFPIFIGRGRNGKGTFIDTLMRIFGDYGRQVPTELLMAKKQESHPADRATLWGTRFAAAEETDEGRELNVALVKQITGGGRISARFMNENFFEFDPTHKIVLSTNNRPVIREQKDAIWRRVKIINWSVVVPDERTDLALKDRLWEEAPGILRWCVEGAMEWQCQGLQPPSEIAASTAEYRDDQDPLREFLRDECVVEAGNESRRVRTAFFLERFNQWASRMHYREMDAKAIKSRMIDAGFAPPSVTGGGYAHWLGVEFKVRDSRDRTGSDDD